MTDERDADEAESGADVGHDVDAERVTAPMSDYSMRAVTIGFAVFVVGLVVAYALPVLAA